MTEDALNIDQCVDKESICEKLKEFNSLLYYASDYAPTIRTRVAELKKRLEALGEEC